MHKGVARETDIRESGCQEAGYQKIRVSGSKLPSRRILPVLTVGAALALLAGCAGGPGLAPAPTPADVSLDVKIGQMIMVGFRGLDVNSNSPIIRDIFDRRIGGVILFDYDVPTSTPIRNIKSPAQLKRLTAKLQAVSRIPLLIAIDQEGGKVCRLKQSSGFPPTLSAQYLGSINDLSLTRRHAARTAKILAHLGINLNLARQPHYRLARPKLLRRPAGRHKPRSRVHQGPSQIWCALRTKAFPRPRQQHRRFASRPDRYHRHLVEQRANSIRKPHRPGTGGCGNDRSRL